MFATFLLCRHKYSECIGFHLGGSCKKKVEFRCADSNHCIDRRLVCDDVIHCVNGGDEENLCSVKGKFVNCNLIEWLVKL